ncbi:MAG: DNA recombination protein RmuC [Candidatus Thioglobus sp.]|nr:MAG: DNA recombination protein RmuC [Candidatus Thioglobus sp.]
MEMLLVLLGVLLGAAGVYFWLNPKLHENTQLKSDFRNQQDKLEKLSLAADELLIVKQENSNIKATLAEKLVSDEFIKHSKTQMQDDFKKIATEILKQDKDELSNKNTTLLQPLSTQLNEFKKRMETMVKEQSDDRSALKQEIQSLSIANQNTLKGAEKLANALTYDNKQQGNWGEMVLESILQDSGLQKDKEYETQKAFKNDSGELLKPDVIVHLPDNKDIVIDSKVSLVAYQEYVADTDNKENLKKHIQSVNNHIKNISLKSYENLEKVNTLDFIFVFFPIEASLLVALEQKPNLFNDALKKNVALVSPSTLMMSLKTVYHIWQTDRQNKNTEEIVRQAGAMYDKLYGFIGDLNKVGAQLKNAQKSYEDANSKLSEGNGNIFITADKIKKLGVPTKKELENIQ